MLASLARHSNGGKERKETSERKGQRGKDGTGCAHNGNRGKMMMTRSNEEDDCQASLEDRRLSREQKARATMTRKQASERASDTVKRCVMRRESEGERCGRELLMPATATACLRRAPPPASLSPIPPLSIQSRAPRPPALTLPSSSSFSLPFSLTRSPDATLATLLSTLALPAASPAHYIRTPAAA